MDLSKLTDEQLALASKISEKAEEKGLNPDFVLPMVMQESGFNHNSKSKKGAIGVMQIMPKTASDYKCKDPNDVDQNIDCGLNILNDLVSKKHIGNDPYRLLVAYNAGPNSSYFKTGKIEDLPEETINHLDKISNIYGGDLPNPSNGQQNQSDESALAKSSNGSKPTSESGTPPPPDTRGGGITDITGTGPAWTPNQLNTFGGMVGLATGLGGTGAIQTAKILNNIKNRVTGTGVLGNIGDVADPEFGKSAIISDELREPSLFNTDAQTERILKGGEGSTLGTTGRARQTGYNIQTAQEAASKKAADEIAEFVKRTGMSEFDATQFLAKQPGLTASPAGVIHPRTLARPTIGPRTYEQAPLKVQASQSGIPTIASGEVPIIGGANAATPHTPSPLPVTSTVSAMPEESALGRMAQMLKSTARTAGHVFAPVAKIGISGLGGALAANQLYEADQNRRMYGLTPENIMDYLSGAGGALSMIPTVPTQAAGFALQVPAIAHGAYKQMKRPETYRAYADPANIGLY